MAQSKLSNLSKLREFFTLAERLTKMTSQNVLIAEKELLIRQLNTFTLDISLSPGLASLHSSIAALVQHMTSMTFLHGWMLVMLVSYTEAYLETVLSQLIEQNPRWMSDLKLKLSYADLERAALSPEPLEHMRSRWRRCWVNNILKDKQRQWITKLVSLGVQGYPPGLAENLTTVWRRRHEIVHTGAVSAHMSGPELTTSIEVIANFINPTDRFVVAFLHSHL